MRQRAFFSNSYFFTVFGRDSFSLWGEAAAVVNGEKISQERFDRYFAQLKMQAEQTGASFEGEEGKKNLDSLKQNAMDGLIYETLIFQAAEQKGTEATDKEIDEYIIKVKDNLIVTRDTRNS